DGCRLRHCPLPDQGAQGGAAVDRRGGHQGHLAREGGPRPAGDSGLRFVGNVEGRDLMSDAADVVVTDGFTGNVALKTLEGSLKFLVSAVFDAMNSSDEVKSVSHLLLDALAPVAAELDPDATGGAMLLGVEGVCIISHGSSSARAIVNAVRVAGEMVDGQLVDRLSGAVAAT